MSRRLYAAVAVLALGGALSVSAPAGASHSCMPEMPCYPHTCIDIKKKPYVYFCNG